MIISHMAVKMKLGQDQGKPGIACSPPDSPAAGGRSIPPGIGQALRSIPKKYASSSFRDKGFPGNRVQVIQILLMKFRLKTFVPRIDHPQIQRVQHGTNVLPQWSYNNIPVLKPIRD